jgi:hypothetical protein
MTPEPFVSAEEAVKFVPVRRRHLLALARKGISGAYSIDPKAKRKVWIFRLSELIAAIANSGIHKNEKVCDPASGSPR